MLILAKSAISSIFIFYRLQFTALTPHICERKKNCTKNQFQLSKLGCQNRPFHSELKMGKYYNKCALLNAKINVLRFFSLCRPIQDKSISKNIKKYSFQPQKQRMRIIPPNLTFLPGFYGIVLFLDSARLIGNARQKMIFRQNLQTYRTFLITKDFPLLLNLELDGHAFWECYSQWG